MSSGGWLYHLHWGFLPVHCIYHRRSTAIIHSFLTPLQLTASGSCVEKMLYHWLKEAAAAFLQLRAFFCNAACGIKCLRCPCLEMITCETRERDFFKNDFSCNSSIHYFFHCQNLIPSFGHTIVLQCKFYFKHKLIILLLIYYPFQK